MNMELEGHVAPKFYGATTVGERGQVVIPAEARRDLNLTPATKLLVFGTHKGGIMITRAETFASLLSQTMSAMARLEETLKSDLVPSKED